MALLETLWDDFTDPTLSATKWTATGAVAITGGVATLTGSASTSMDSSGLYTFGTGTNNSYLQAKVTLSGGATTFELRLWDTTGLAAVAARIDAGFLYTRVTNTSGANSDYQLAAYNPATMAYLRVRTAGATAVSVGYSADGITWTYGTGRTLPFASETAVRASFIHGTTTPAHTITVDNVNYAPIETLTDDFTAGTLDVAKWTNNSINGGTATVANGVLNLASGVSGTPDVRSKALYRLGASSSIIANISNPAGTHTIRLFVKNGTGTGESQMAIYNNALYCYNASGNQVSGSPIPYVAAQHAWWRMRFAVVGTSVTTYFDTSPDGLTWTQRLSGTAQAWTDTTCYAQTTLTGGANVTSTVDYVNIVPLITNVAPVEVADVETLGAPALTFVPTPLLETLTDTFETGVLDTVKWAESVFGGSVAVSDGVLKTVTGTASGSFSGVLSASTYTLGRLSQLTVKVALDPSGASSAYSTQISVQYSPTSGVRTGGCSTIVIGSGNLIGTVYDSAGSGIQSMTQTYNATNHAWLRMRFDVAGNTVTTYFDTSPDNVVWTQQAFGSKAWTGPVAYVSLRGYNNGVATPRFSTFDNVNITAPKVLGQLVDTFDGATLDPQWVTTGTTGTGATVAVGGGVLRLNTTTASSTSVARVETADLFSVFGQSVTVRLSPANQVGSFTTYLYLTNGVGNGSVYIGYAAGTNQVTFQVVNSSGTLIYNTARTRSITNDLYWRIRMDADGTNVYLEYSGDATTWTIQTTATNLGWGRSARFRIQLQNGGAQSGAVRIDSVNAAPNAFADSITDDFGGSALDTTKWTATTAAGGSVSVSGGKATFVTTADGVTSAAAITSVRTDLIIRDAWVMATPGPVSTATDVFTALTVTAGGRSYSMGFLNGNLVWQLDAGAFNTIAAYNTNTMAYWRIVGSIPVPAVNPSLVCQYSADGVTWSATSGSTVATWATAVAAQFGVRNNNAITAGTSSTDTINLPAVAPPLLGTLADTFSTGTLDLAKWTNTSVNGGTATVSGGVLNLVGPGGGAGEVRSRSNYTLGPGQQLLAKISFNTGNVHVIRIHVKCAAGVGESQIALYQSGIYFFNTTTAQVGSTIGYDPVAHAWLRMRFDVTGTSVITYYETSPDGAAWTQRAVGGAQTWASTICYAQFRIEDGVSIIATVDNVNTIPPYATLDPTSVADPETHGGPVVDFVASSSTPDTVTDAETLGPPALTFAADSVEPGSLADPETLGEPTATLTRQAQPSGIADTEAFGEPTLPLFTTGAPDGLADDETLDDLRLSFQASNIDPAGITDPEALGSALSAFYPSEIDPAGIEDPLTVGTPSVDFISHYTGAYSTGVYGVGPYSGIAFEPHGIVDLDVVGRPGLSDATVVPPDTIIVAGIVDEETLGQPSGSLPNPTNLLYGMGTYSEGPYWGSGPPPPQGDTVPNLNYGYGTYGYGIYYGTVAWEPARPLFPEATKPAPPLHILGIGPWSSQIDWRGAPNYRVRGGHQPARPAMPLPPATGKGFTLRLGDGSEARCELAFSRDSALVIDEMDTDLWWRRKDPRTGKLEMIGRFNTAHVSLSTTDTGISCSVQFVDYQTILGERMVLDYLDRAHSESQWAIGTPVTQILAWALPKNTPLDLTQVTGGTPYDLGKTTEAFHLPPDTNMADLMDNLNAISAKHWEWWVETPLDIHQPPKLRFVIGERGRDRGVTLFDVGSGPTPIAQWTRNAASDEYANALYYTGGDPKAGLGAGGGVILNFPTQIEQYGQRDALYGNSSVDGGNKEVLKQRANRKLETLADRRASYTVRLAQGYWRGREHVDVGDLIGLRLRMGKDFLHEKFRVSELTVDIDDNGLEEVTLNLGRLTTSADPRSKRSPIARVVRYLKNYVAPNGAADLPTPDD